jgi:hypothetical protein
MGLERDVLGGEGCERLPEGEGQSRSPRWYGQVSLRSGELPVYIIILISWLVRAICKFPFRTDVGILVVLQQCYSWLCRGLLNTVLHFFYQNLPLNNDYTSFMNFFCYRLFSGWIRIRKNCVIPYRLLRQKYFSQKKFFGLLLKKNCHRYEGMEQNLFPLLSGLSGLR